jgi:oligopeptide/dipeptide ABC transporter ATP-binding protein
MEKGFVRSMLFITHELPLLYNVTDSIMVMYAGEIVERGTAKEMVFDPLMPYSRGLMNSIIVPEEGTRGHVLQAIPGAPPNLKIRPEGCRFSESAWPITFPIRCISWSMVLLWNRDRRMKRSFIPGPITLSAFWGMFPRYTSPGISAEKRPAHKAA